MLQYRLLASIPVLVALAACGGEGSQDSSTETTAAGEQTAAALGIDPDVPSIKAGKWRISTASMSGPDFPAQTVCLTPADAAAKKGLGERAASLPCAPRDVRREGEAVVIEAVCNVGGVASTISTRAYGDFNSDYYIDYVENLDPPPADQPAELKRKLHARLMSEDC